MLKMNIMHNTLQLSSAERSLFQLLDLPLSQEPAESLARLDTAISNWKFYSGIDVVNCRVAEKIRNNLAALTGQPARASRDIPRFKGATRAPQSPLN